MKYLNHPVIASDGFCYEKSALLIWLNDNNTIPKTREKINKNTFPCITKKQQVTEFLLKNPEYKNVELIQDISESLIHHNTNNFMEVPFYGAYNLVGFPFYGGIYGWDNNVGNFSEDSIYYKIHKFNMGPSIEDLQNITEIDLEKLKDWYMFINFPNLIMKRIFDLVINLTAIKDNMFFTHFICKYCRGEVIKHLIDKIVILEKINPNCSPNQNSILEKYDCDGRKFIHYICEFSNFDTIKYIIDKGVDINALTIWNYRRPLHFVLAFKNLDVINYIIDKKIIIEKYKTIKSGHREFNQKNKCNLLDLIKWNRNFDIMTKYELALKLGYSKLYLYFNF